MDTIALVNEYIEDGERLLKGLPGQGFPVTGAVWLLSSDAGEWQFYVISPRVEATGPQRAYRELHTAIRLLHPRWIDVLEVKLVGENEPVGTAGTGHSAECTWPQSVFNSVGRQPSW